MVEYKLFLSGVYFEQVLVLRKQICNFMSGCTWMLKGGASRQNSTNVGNFKIELGA